MAEANYVPHCADESCDLGVLEYRCPCCGERQTSYDFLQHHCQEMRDGKVLQFQCDCRAPLQVRWDDKTSDYDVRPYEMGHV